MDLKFLKYGYYQLYNSGDGSMYDHCTAYEHAQKYTTIFYEDKDNYFDVFDDNKPYSKNSAYNKASVTIVGEILDMLPSCIDIDKDYTIDEIRALLPRKMASRLSQKPEEEVQKVL